MRYTKKLVLILNTIWFGALPGYSQETNLIPTLPALQQSISNFLAEPRFDSALWGVKIVSLGTGITLFESHADRLMSPASNCKLFTGALALDRFGGAYRIATPIYATARPDRSGTINGDLVIAGHGDATWNSRRFGTNFWAIFEPFFAALTNAGVRHVTGNLVADASFFKGPPICLSSKIDDFESGECPLISALTLNDELAQVRIEPARVGEPCRVKVLQPDTGLVFSNCTKTVPSNSAPHLESYRRMGEKVIYLLGQTPIGATNKDLDVPVLEPERWFGIALKHALARQGIEISGQVRTIAWPQSAISNSRDVKIGEVFSPPLREVIRLFMKPSQNLETDILLSHIGEMTRSSNTAPWRTSRELGLDGLRQFLISYNLPVEEIDFDEGSGLSEHNMATANSLVALLQVMSRHPAAQDFADALPIAAVDGTLRRRFHDTIAAGNIHAKTGTLAWVNSLSGYVTSAADEHLAFSFILNRYRAMPDEGRIKQLDTIALMLARFSGRSLPTDTQLATSFQPYGNLYLLHLTNAPFPCPARSGGHRYHNQFFSPKEHYSDDTAAIFFPKNFHASDKIDFVIHFHGWYHTLAGTLEEYHLCEQFADSGKNAVLIVPQGPFNAPDSFGGKLEDSNGLRSFMDELVTKVKEVPASPLPPNSGIGNIILSGHSGGYHVIAAILDHGGLQIREAWLFDALYGGTETFAAWQKKENGRLLNIYTDHGSTREETENLSTLLKNKGVSFFAGEDTNAAPPVLLTNKIIFLHSNLGHNDVVARRPAFAQFLKSSCLEDQ